MDALAQAWFETRFELLFIKARGDAFQQFAASRTHRRTGRWRALWNKILETVAKSECNGGVSGSSADNIYGSD